MVEEPKWWKSSCIINTLSCVMTLFNLVDEKLHRELYAYFYIQNKEAAASSQVSAHIY